LRIDGIKLHYAVAPKHIAGGIAAVKGARVGAAITEDQAAGAVRIAQIEVGVFHQLADHG